MLEITTLGGLVIRRDGEAVTDLVTRKAEALLVYLACTGRPHAREVLAEMLWEERTPERALGNLRVALTSLRKQVGPYFTIERDSVTANPEAGIRLDVAGLEEALRGGQVETAAALYRGEFLQGFYVRGAPGFEEWASQERERLRLALVDALGGQVERDLAGGAFRAGIEHARRLLALDPLSESAHEQMMLLLAAGGQRSAALVQYETCRAVLAEELGAEPSPQLQATYEQLLKGEQPVGIPPATGARERAPRAVGDCPYRGLAAFREEDAPFFFGREDFAERLERAVQQRPLVAVIVGSSGSGKSSAVFAGLLPRLRAEGGWTTAGFRPGAQPFRALAGSLVPALSPELDEPDRLVAARKLADALQGGELPLADVVDDVLQGQPQGQRLLLVADQFEELYTLCPEREERRRFVDELLAAVAETARKQAPRFVLLLTMRADFMGQALAYRPFADALQEASLMLGPMNREELALAVEKPAAVQGAAFEAGLVERILDDVGQEPGNLPLLEFALTLLWERQSYGWLTHAGYEEIGRVEGALARYADEVFDGLDARARAQARRVFVQLVRPGEGTEDTRRLATRGEVGEENWGLVQHLADKRLVVTGRDATGAETVEMVHEALIEGWGQLQAWMAADRAFRTWQERLRAALGQWQATGEDEGALLRGTPLAEAEGWLGERGEDLSAAELAYIEAGLALRERRLAEQEAQRQRELKATRALAAEQERRAGIEQRRAEEQAESAGRLRQRALSLAGAMVVAAILAVAAFFAFRQADQNATAAQAEAERQATAQVEADVAAVKTGRQRDAAQAEAAARATQQVIAESESQARATQQAIAETEVQARATQQAVAEQKAREAQVAYSLSLVANARQAQADADTELALLLALAASGIEDPPPAAQRALLDIAHAPGTRRRLVTSQENYALDVSPDGRRMLSGARDGTVYLWDLASGELLKRLEGHTSGVLDVVFSPSGQRALSGSYDHTAILWDLDSGEIIQRLEGHTASVRAVAFGPDGRTALTGEDTMEAPGELILWDLEAEGDEGRIVRRFGASAEGNRQGIQSVAISPDGRVALVGLGATPSHDRPLVLWDLETFEAIRFLQGPTSPISEVAISPDGRLGLSGAEGEATVSLWDLETGEELHRLEGHEDWVLGVALSPDGRTALSSDADGVLIWWDLEAGEPLAHLREHTGDTRDVAFVDGSTAVSSSDDGTLRLWELTSAWQLDHWQGEAELRHGLPVTALAISPDGRLALSGAGTRDWNAAPGEYDLDNSLILWDYESGRPLRRLESHRNTVSGVAFSPDGRQALSGSYDGTLILWDLDTGEKIRQMEGHTSGVQGLDISSDGRQALSCDWAGMILLWDLSSGTVVRRFAGHHHLNVQGVAFLAGDRQAVSVGAEASVIVWDLASGQRLRRLIGLTGDVGGHESRAEDIAASPDGRQALSSSWDGMLILWDLASGRSIRRYEGHTGTVHDIDIISDGQTALSGSSDGTLIVWDVATGTPLRHLPVSASFEDPPRVAIHPDGRTALSGEPDGTILKWQLAEPSPAELIAWIGDNRPLRELTCLERETYQIAPLCDEDGTSPATTADLLAAAAASAPTQPSAMPTSPPTGGAPLPTPTPHSTLRAALGENRGELARYEYDVWTYQGEAGEVLSLHMQADRPITGPINLEEEFAAGVMDTILMVFAPDGSLLAQADDVPGWEGQRTDSLIEAVYLPVDGEYRIEAQSYADASAGGYTLTVESHRPDIDPATLQRYVGDYYIPAFPAQVGIEYEEGRLLLDWWPDLWPLSPRNETEFSAQPWNFPLVFHTDGAGHVTGFEVYMWGGWFEAERMEE